MQDRQVNKPIKINADKDPKYLGVDEARYMLNTERNIGGGTNSNLGKTTPMPANELLCNTEVEEGTPLRIGSYKSELTNEVYVFYFVEGGINYILRVNADKTCEVVYEGECLSFSADPKHAIEDWRVYLKYDRFCANQGGKQLIWTDGINTIGQIDVEASIATDGFSTPFFDNCMEGCEPLQMCVPEPCGALIGEFVPLIEEDLSLDNKIIDTGIQVAIRHVYYDQRASELSDISSLYFQDSKGCFDGSEGLPRCIKFRVPVGNPLVDKIEFYFRINNTGGWYLSDTIEKYQPYTSSSQQWYERELADLLNYSSEDCAFDYIFCNDKQCTPISPDIVGTSRVFNPIPREAQGLIRIKDSLAFYNYVKGNCPLSINETKKIELSLNCGDENTCNREYVDVTFYVLVHNVIRNRNQPIYRYGGDNNDEDDKTDPAWFGGLPTARVKGFENYFRGDVRNFIAYIEGTDYTAELEQWYSPKFFIGAKEKKGVLPNMDSYSNYFNIESQVGNGNFYYQKGVFKVPKGTKGFIRLTSHKRTSGRGENQNYSTFVLGKHDITEYTGYTNIQTLMEDAPGDQELYFDASAGNVEIMDALVVADMVKENDTGDHSSTAYAGYLTDENGNPIEGAQIWDGGALKSTTDFNGFYFFYLFGGVDTTITLSIRVEQTNSGAWTEVQTEPVRTGSYGSLTENDFEIDEPYYDDNWYQEFNVRVRDCDNQPIGGIRVALSGNKYKVSDPITGYATFRIRNYVTRNRVANAVIIDYRGCFTLDCDDNCNPSMPEIAPYTLPSEFNNNPAINVDTTTKVNIDSALINVKGLKAGGRYGWGVVAKGSCGRLSAVYPITIMNGSIPNDDSYMNVPKTQEKDSLGFCSIDYNATGIVLDEWVECLDIVRTLNLNNYVLQWVVDKIERVGNGRIKLTIQSLNDYNARYNFETTTIYQYVKGDRIEFISNGDGEIFDTATYGILNYQILSPFVEEIEEGSAQPETNFFNEILIQDDGSLDGLVEGAKIELQRPNECTVENNAYYSVASLQVVEISGVKQLAEPVGNFITFDTYFVTRQIDKQPIQVFEHKNPSDFWGDEINGISDIGKAYFENKFENEKRYGRNITINSKNQFNRFGDLEKTLDAPEQGDLISMGIYDGKIGIGIGEYDNFLFQVSDEFLRVGSDGTVRAAPADSLISDAEPKIVGQFGCKYDHIGSVFYGDGFVTWADIAKGAFVKHDFSAAKNIAEGKMDTYFRKKWNLMELFNSVSSYDYEKYRFVTGFNYHTNALQLTMKKLNGSTVHNEKDYLLSESETILIEPRTEEMLTMVSYAYDGYSNLDIKDGMGCAFISFDKGATYIHPIETDVYNRFSGVACDRVITVAINKDPDIIKRAIGIEVQDEKMWFVSKVLVDRTSFESEIPPIKMQKEEDKWVGSFLSDKNSIGGLYAQESVGTKPRGYFMLITLVRDNTDELKYNTIDNQKRIQYDTLDMILTKYFYSAQSGLK